MGEEKDESFHGVTKEQGTETQALVSGPGHMALDKPASWPVIWWLSSSNVYRLSPEDDADDPQEPQFSRTKNFGVSPSFCYPSTEDRQDLVLVVVTSNLSKVGGIFSSPHPHSPATPSIPQANPRLEASLPRKPKNRLQS